MTPKIKFRYSWIFDQRYKQGYEMRSPGREPYPPLDEIKTYIKEVESIWGEKSEKILSAMSRLSGIEWEEKEIICYVIGIGRGLSDPLTMKIYKDKEEFIDVLVHELIHIIQSQEHVQFWKWKEYLNTKYSEEPMHTKNHIFVHALHKEIYLKLFDEKRLKRDIEKCQKHEDYKRAWEIVEKEGYENIINEFKKKLGN